jgi:hypothetical protein
MGLLQTKIDPTTAKNIMYMCAAAPVLAFGARMVKSAMECVLTSRSTRETSTSRSVPISESRRSPTHRARLEPPRTRDAAAKIGDGLRSSPFD